MTPWFHLIHVFAFLHSLYVHGKKWSLLFLMIGFSLGFHYQPNRIMFFGTVPILTPLSWWLILYCAYNTTTLIVGSLERISGRGLHLALAVLIMASLDGLMAMNLDR